MQASEVIVLTREPEDNRDLASRLERAGAQVREIPCILTRLRDPDPAELERLPAPGQVGALAFTSRRAVQGWVRWVGTASAGSWPRLLPVDRIAVAAVGRSTARALEEAGMKPGLVADPPTGESLARLLATHVPPDRCIVLPGGEMRAGGLEAGLEEAECTTRTLTLYANDDPRVPALDPFPVAAVFVASPSAGRRLLDAMPWMKACPFVSIGPTTSRALRELGVESIREPGPAPEHWLRALLDAAGVHDHA